MVETVQIFLLGAWASNYNRGVKTLLLIIRFSAIVTLN
jgi:hypothetical protein